MPVSKRGQPPEVKPLTDAPESVSLANVFERVAMEELPQRETHDHAELQSDKRPGRPRVYVADWAPVFLGEICKGASIRRAARVAGVHETMPYKRRSEDKEFADAWRAMSNISTELLEEEAVRRAYHGTLKPVFFKGERCGYAQQHSDVLLMFLLKKRDPTYRENSSVTVNNNTLSIFDDIEKTVKLIEGGEVSRVGPDPSVDIPPDGDVPADGHAEPLDEAQSTDPQEE